MRKGLKSVLVIGRRMSASAWSATIVSVQLLLEQGAGGNAQGGNTVLLSRLLLILKKRTELIRETIEHFSSAVLSNGINGKACLCLLI